MYSLLCIFVAGIMFSSPNVSRFALFSFTWNKGINPVAPPSIVESANYYIGDPIELNAKMK